MWLYIGYIDEPITLLMLTLYRDCSTESLIALPAQARLSLRPPVIYYSRNLLRQHSFSSQYIAFLLNLYCNPGLSISLLGLYFCANTIHSFWHPNIPTFLGIGRKH